MWKIFLLLLIAVVAGFAYFAMGILSPSLNDDDIPVQEKTWDDPEDIARDPIGYLEWAQVQVAEAVLTLQQQKGELTRQKVEAERRVSETARERELVARRFEELRVFYRNALAQGAWPVQVADQSYEESALKNEIVAQSAKLDGLDASMVQFETIQDSLDEYLATLERRLSEAKTKSAEIVRQTEIAKVEDSLSDLTSLDADIEGILSATGVISPLSSTPNVEQLIRNERKRVGDDQFRDVLLRDIDGAGGSADFDLSRGPFFDQRGEPLVWYHLTGAGDYELYPRPGVHPDLGVPLEPMTPEVANAFRDWLEKREKTQREEAERLRVAEKRRATEQVWKKRTEDARARARSEARRWQNFVANSEISAEIVQHDGDAFSARGDTLAATKDYEAATRAFNNAQANYLSALKSGSFSYRDSLTERLNDMLDSGLISHSDVNRDINARILKADELVERGEYDSAIEMYHSIFSPYIDIGASTGRTVRQ